MVFLMEGLQKLKKLQEEAKSKIIEGLNTHDAGRYYLNIGKEVAYHDAIQIIEEYLSQ